MLANDLSPSEFGDRRHEPRQAVVEGAVRINGADYPVKNWSPGGFLLRDYASDHEIGEHLDILFSLPLQFGSLEFGCGAVILRIDRRKRELAGAFVALDTAAKVAIAQHFFG